MAKPTNAQLVAWIEAEIRNARGYEGSDLAQIRKQALDRYYGRPRGDEAPGRSDVQSNDIADMVEAIVAQVLPAFSQDSIAEFEPETDEDVLAAQAESDVVNETIVEANNGYTMFQSSLRDALLLRNGWIRIWLDEREIVSRDEYEELDAEAAAQIMMNAEQRGEVEVVDQTKGPDDETGAPSWERLVLQVTETKRQVRVASVDPVHMAWNSDHDSVYIENIRFLSEVAYPTRSDLIADGYSKTVVNRIPPYGTRRDAQETGREGYETVNFEAIEHSMQQLRVRYIHYRYDSDGDGIAELHRIVFLEDADVSDAILDNEIVEFVPYATGTPILQPHRLDGLGVYDKLEEVEKGKTAVLRQWLDNQKTANQPGLAFNVNRVAVDDVTLRRPGGGIRVDGEIGPNLMPVPVTDVGPSCERALAYFDKVRSERSGASLDLMAEQQLVAGDTAHGIERQISAKELMAAMMTRTLAETLVRQTYQLTHRAMRSWLNGEIQMRARGRTTLSNPATWRPRDRVNVKTGLSVSERMARKASLQSVLAMQGQLWQAGEQETMVTRDNYYAALMDWARCAQIDAPESYFTDPSSHEAQQAAQGKAQQQQELQSIQLQIAQTAASAEQQRQQIENALDAWKTEQDNAYKYWSDTLQAEIELMKAAQAEASEVRNATQQGSAGGDQGGGGNGRAGRSGE